MKEFNFSFKVLYLLKCGWLAEEKGRTVSELEEDE